MKWQHLLISVLSMIMSFNLLVFIFVAFSVDMNENKPDKLPTLDVPVCVVSAFEHDVRRWVRTNFSEQETWPCCGWDAGDWRRYPEQCGTRPMAKPGNSYTGNKEFYAHGGGYGCHGACEPTDGSIIAAQWTPTTCTLPLFDASYFCTTVLRNRSMLLIGDSTFEQTATVLMNAVHHHCPEQIRHAQGDTLIGRGLGGLNRGPVWTKSVDRFDPDIVMMGIGPHVKTDEDYKAVLETVYTQFTKQYVGDRSKILIWKTINPGGYPELGILDELAEYNQTMETWNPSGYQSHWERDMFPRWDKMAKEM